MRNAVIGAAVVICLLLASMVAAQMPSAGISRPGSQAAGGGLIALATSVDAHQFVTVIDPELRTIAVYSINVKGELTLCSARNIQGDLQLDEFMGTKPLPQEIRAALNMKKASNMPAMRP